MPLLCLFLIPFQLVIEDQLIEIESLSLLPVDSDFSPLDVANELVKYLAELGYYCAFRKDGECTETIPLTELTLENFEYFEKDIEDGSDNYFDYTFVVSWDEIEVN